MRRCLLVPLACLALVACDDGESIDPEADAERIEDALLQLDDLPDGFEEAGADDDDADNECTEEVLGIDRDELDEAKTAETEQAHFSLGEETDVRAEITAFRDGDLPERILEGVGEEDYVDCLGDTLGDDLPDTVELRDLDEVDSPVDGGRSVEATLLFSDGSEEADIVTQQHGVLVGRFAVSLVVTQLGGAPDEALVEDALEAMIGRLEADA